MSDDFDLNDIMLEAVAEVQEIVREVLEELAAPQEKLSAMKAWMEMSDEEKDAFASEQPDQYRAMVADMERRTKP